MKKACSTDVTTREPGLQRTETAVTFRNQSAPTAHASKRVAGKQTGLTNAVFNEKHGPKLIGSQGLVQDTQPCPHTH